MPKTEVIDQETGEVLEVNQPSNLPAIKKQASGVMIGGQKFEVKRLVNVPTLKHETGETVAFIILMPIVAGMNEVTEEVTVDGVKMMATRQVPINVVRVQSLYDQKEYEYVLNAIAADSLSSTYPEDSYVGKPFAIYKGQVVAGKRYKEVEVLELEAQ